MFLVFYFLSHNSYNKLRTVTQRLILKKKMEWGDKLFNKRFVELHKSELYTDVEPDLKSELDSLQNLGLIVIV